MTLVLLIVVLAALGYVVAFPIVVRGVKDIGRIPGAVWRVTGYTNRKSWRVAMIGGYALGGWPGALVVMKWRYGEEREVLRDEWKLLIEERAARHEIVLSHYEDEPDEAETSS
ncbi:MAG: hypothetical protein ACXVKA_10730 [Acidimicrobiia bacterium]